MSEQLPRHEQRLRIVTADGRVRNVVRRARLVFDRHGVPLEFAGVDIDIGEADAGLAVTAGLPSQIKGFKLPVGVLAEKQPSPGNKPSAILDAALREKEDVYRATLEALPAHIAVVARDGQIMAVNSAWSRFAENNQGSLPSVAVAQTIWKFAAGPQLPEIATLLGLSAASATFLQAFGRNSLWNIPVTPPTNRVGFS